MITKNINNQPLHSSYNSIIQSDNREILVKLIANGNELNCGIKRLEITKGACGDTTQFNVGSVVGSSFIAEVLDLTTDVKGETISIQIGLLIDEQNDTWEYLTIGTYTVTDVKKTLYSTTITGYGTIITLTGDQFIEPQGTKTISSIIYSIYQSTGKSVLIPASINTSLVVEQSLYGLTIFQVLQIIAQLIGGYAIDTEDGKISFELFGNTATHTVNSGLMTTLPDVAEQDFTITGVSCTVSEASNDGDADIPAVGYTQGSPLNFAIINPYMTRVLFNQFAINLLNYTYRPGTVQLSLGDPRIQSTDVLTVVDANDDTYKIPCHSIRHIYDGGFRTEIIAANATNLENKIGSATPFEEFIRNTQSTFVGIETDLKNLYNDVQYFWHDNQGAHIATVPKEDYYNGSACIEVLITSSEIQFRALNNNHTIIYIYSRYTNSEIKLGTYATLSELGLILENVSRGTKYQIKPDIGIIANNDYVYIDYGTNEQINFNSFNVMGIGIAEGNQTIRFTLSAPCSFAPGVILTPTSFKARITTQEGYPIDNTTGSTNKNFLAAGYTLSVDTCGGNTLALILNKSSDFYANTPTGLRTLNLYEPLIITCSELSFYNTLNRSNNTN